MITKLFSKDAFTGITKYWHYDELTDTAVIESVHDIEPLLELNAESRKVRDKHTRWGELSHVAHIPADVYAEWLRTGMDKDQAAVRRWLNDPENRRHRTREGKV